MKRIEAFDKSRALSQRAHELIPAGCHTYSKGDDQFPFDSPGFIERGSGCYVTDVDGNRFLDWGMGLRSVILGHAYPRVLEAVHAHLQWGSNFPRPAPVEVELAEILVDLIPCAEMVKFAKDGSDVTSGAVRLARAYTCRPMVAICREHPFFSFNDWFIGSTPCNAGVPEAVQALTVKFNYNDLQSLERIFSDHPGQIAAVVLEPVAFESPQAGFLEGVRDISRRHGAVLIFDEMISGFRFHLGGAQTHFNVTPDLATFGKALANGFSVSALVGWREIMELGGIKHNKPRVFLLSATHGAETHALAAAVATVAELKEKEVIPHLWRIGSRLQQGLKQLVQRFGLDSLVEVAGYPCSPLITFRDAAGGISMPLRTLFLQEMIAHGVLIPWVAVSFSHGDAEVQLTLDAAEQALEVLRKAVREGSTDRYLAGPPAKPVFRRFN